MTFRQEFSQLLAGWHGEYREVRGWVRLVLELEILESNLFDIFGETAPIKDTRLDDFD